MSVGLPTLAMLGNRKSAGMAGVVSAGGVVYVDEGVVHTDGGVRLSLYSVSRCRSSRVIVAVVPAASPYWTSVAAPSRSSSVLTLSGPYELPLAETKPRRETSTHS